MLREVLSNRVFMGSLGCLVLLGIGCLLYLTSLNREGQQVSDPSETPVNSSEARTPETTEEPEGTAPPAPPNEKAQQGGHWHGDEWHAEPHTDPAPTPKQQLQPAIPLSDDVIYPHHELLKSHPVEALRQQAIENGNWAAKWIPPFPPDDQEAAAVARNLYLMKHYIGIGDTENPIFIKAYEADSYYYKNTFVERYPAKDESVAARAWDMMKLGWATLDDPLREDSEISSLPSEFPTK